MTEYQPSTEAFWFPEFLVKNVATQKTDGDPLPQNAMSRLNGEIGQTLVARLAELHPEGMPNAVTYGANLRGVNQFGQQSVLQISAVDAWWREANSKPTFPSPAEFPEYWERCRAQSDSPGSPYVASYKLFISDRFALPPVVPHTSQLCADAANAQGELDMKKGLHVRANYHRTGMASLTSRSIPALGAHLVAMGSFFEQVPKLEVESLFALNLTGFPIQM